MLLHYRVGLMWIGNSAFQILGLDNAVAVAVAVRSGAEHFLKGQKGQRAETATAAVPR